MHIEVHKSIGIICEEYHTDFVMLMLLGLVCFVLGFGIARIGG